MISDDGKGSSSSKKKLKALEEELTIKATALKEAEQQLEKRNALVEDLENQLRSTGDASTVRELNHQLRQMVLVHRQLLRKVRVCVCVWLCVCVCARIQVLVRCSGPAPSTTRCVCVRAVCGGGRGVQRDDHEAAGAG